MPSRTDRRHPDSPSFVRRSFLGGASTVALASALAACGGASADSTTGSSKADSGTLAFGSEGNVATLALATKTRKQLTKVPSGGLARDPIWSADGKSLLYAYSPPLPNVRGPGGLLPLPVTDLHSIPADGGDSKLLVEHDAPGAGYETPAWAPDGKSVYVTYTALVVESNIVKDQITELARVPVGGGARQTLVSGAMFPSFSADGKKLAYVAVSPDGLGLGVADADGKNARQVLPPGKLDGVSAPRLSPDGKQIAFTAIAPMPPVATVTPVPRRTGFLSPPAALAHGLPMDVFVLSVDNGSVRRLTLLGEDSPAVAWSADGKRIAILAGGGIYVMNADGSDFANVDTRGGHGTVDWRR